MIRDYSNLVDLCVSAAETGDFSDSLLRNKVRETIENDDIDDAVENVMKIMYEFRYEW